VDNETFAARIAFKRSELRQQQAGWRPLSATSIEDLILEEAGEMLTDGDAATVLRHARRLQTALHLYEAGRLEEALNALAVMRLGASPRADEIDLDGLVNMRI